MFVRKKKFLAAQKELFCALQYIQQTKPFAQIGVQAAQEALRGYKWLNFSHVNSRSSRSVTFNLALKKFEETEGNNAKKLEAALSSIHENTSYYFSSSIMKDKKNILKNLEAVTNISPHTGELIAFQNIEKD